MSRVQELRAAIDQSLDRWEAAAQSVEDSINETQDAIADRLEDQKEKGRKAVDDLKQAVTRAKNLPAEARQKVISNLEHLDVQLALGKAEVRDVLENQQAKISEAVQKVDTELDALDRQIDRDVEEAIKAWIEAEIALQQELDLGAMYMAQKEAQAHATFEKKKEEIQEQVNKFRNTLEGKRGEAAQKGTAFGEDMSQAFEQIKSAFRNLPS